MGTCTITYYYYYFFFLFKVFFELFDQDKDGYLNEYELTAALKMLVELKTSNSVSAKETENEETIIDAILTEHQEKLQVHFVKCKMF